MLVLAALVLAVKKKAGIKLFCKFIRASHRNSILSCYDSVLLEERETIEQQTAGFQQQHQQRVSLIYQTLLHLEIVQLQLHSLWAFCVSLMSL